VRKQWKGGTIVFKLKVKEGRRKENRGGKDLKEI